MATVPAIRGSQWESEGEAISSAGRLASACLATCEAGQERWYAVQTRSRHEKLVATSLQGRGVAAYLPLVSEVHRWSDRRKQVDVPLFSGYVFIRSVDSNEAMSKVICADGVVSIVGARPRGTPIPDGEIEAIQTLLARKVLHRNHMFLECGQRVRIRGGALEGVEGILLAQKSETSLVVSVNLIQRSIAMKIEGYDVEPI